MGIGEPQDIWSLVKHGIDTFDCVSPTRLARHGAALSKNQDGKINIKNASNREDLSPLDKTCHCLTCTNYSKGKTPTPLHFPDLYLWFFIAFSCPFLSLFLLRWSDDVSNENKN